MKSENSKEKPIKIGEFKDELYPFEGYDHIRYTARALLENEEGKFGFLHLVGNDFFGDRDHLETCGGGIEEGENLYDTIKREVMEEMGLEVVSCKYIGSIVDTYNLIRRITCSGFFHCLVDTRNKKETHRTEMEKNLIKGIVWLEPLEALDWLENRHEHKVDVLVQRRDALALKYYLEHYTEVLKK